MEEDSRWNVDNPYGTGIRHYTLDISFPLGFEMCFYASAAFQSLFCHFELVQEPPAKSFWDRPLDLSESFSFFSTWWMRYAHTMILTGATAGFRYIKLCDVSTWSKLVCFFLVHGLKV